MMKGFLYDYHHVYVFVCMNGTNKKKQILRDSIGKIRVMVKIHQKQQMGITEKFNQRKK